MSSARAPLCSAPSRRRRSHGSLLGTFYTLGAASALAIAFSPAAEAGPRFGARPYVHAAKIGAKVGPKAYWISSKFKRKDADREHVSKEPFGAIPEGPLQIVISIDQQQLHLYSDGAHVADTPVATGVPEHPTPLGVFSVIDKERYHESNIYSRAPMPYMQRITWSGVAMHQGNGAGHRASHGCIRMPEAFAAKFWVLHSLGARVVIARPELTPEEVADLHLFVHKEPPQPALTATVESVKTAQTIDSSKTSDAANGAPLQAIADAPAAADAKPATTAGAAASADASAAAVRATSAANEPNLSAAARDADALPPALPVSPQTSKPAEPPADRAAKPATDATPEVVPVPPPKPADLVRGAIGAPIAIFVSRKTGRIYVRQHFKPLFDAAIVIDHPDQPLGTHVFTAMEYLDDGSTFRWNVISLPGEPKVTRGEKVTRSEKVSDKLGKWRHKDVSDAKVPDLPPPQTPQEALARIQIPQAVIDRISELMVAGSSLVVSDQGLGEETGEGTDFVVVTR